MRADDGTLVAGRSPSGAPRGDKHVLFRELLDGGGDATSISGDASSTSPTSSERLSDEASGTSKEAESTNGSASGDTWPGLAAADEALGLVGSALAAHLREGEWQREGSGEREGGELEGGKSQRERPAPTSGGGGGSRPGMELGKRSDSFVACFPGDGLGYGAHVRELLTSSLPPPLLSLLFLLLLLSTFDTSHLAFSRLRTLCTA